MDTVRVKVDDADCESCMKVIKKKLKALNGVKDVSVDVKRKEVVIKYDNTQLCLDDFSCAIEALGYNKVQIVPWLISYEAGAAMYITSCCPPQWRKSFSVLIEIGFQG